MKKTEGVKAVEKVLKRGQACTYRGLKASKVCFDGIFIFALLPGKKWAASINGENVATHLDGCIGGYSVHAINILTPLIDNQLINRADANEFRDWFRAEEEENKKASDLVQMYKIAAKYGFEVNMKE